MTGLRFNGEGSEFFKIWIVNVLLTIVTVGLYYPWAKVRTKRYFYGNTTLENKNFEYHATGKQLFISYLIAMVLFIAYVILQNMSPALSFAVFAIAFVAFPWVIWRSLIFNMRVTSFANVRFRFEGKLSDAYMVYIVYPFILMAIAVVLLLITGPFSLLLLIPLYIYALAYLKKKITEYKINGSRYGQGRFSTQLDLNPLVMITLKTFGVFIAATVAYLIVVSTLAGASMAALSDLAYIADNPDIVQQNPALIFSIIAVVYGGMFFVGLITYAFSESRYRTYIYQNSKLDDSIEFFSSLSARRLTWVLFSNFILLVFTLGLALPWTKVRMARAMVENTHVKSDASLNSYVSQETAKQSALGEELGDAFDVDAGIAL